MCNDYLKIHFILYLILPLCSPSASFETQNCSSNTSRTACLQYDNCLYAENSYKHDSNSECINIASVSEAKQFCGLFYRMNSAEGFTAVACESKEYANSHS